MIRLSKDNILIKYISKSYVRFYTVYQGGHAVTGWQQSVT